MKKKTNRLIAITLVFSIGLSWFVQSLAEPFQVSASENNRMVVGDAWGEELIQMQKDERPLYNKLVEQNGVPKEPGYLADEGDDWAEEYKVKVAQKGIDEALNEVMEAAESKIDADYVRKKFIKDPKTSNDVLSIVADTIDCYGSIMAFTDAMTLFGEVLELQGDTVEQQLMELVVLTAEFGVAAFAVVGMSIGFPWGLILSLVLDLLLDLIRKGVFWNDVVVGDPDNGSGDERYKLQDGTNVYKPNIYIYSRDEREVTVTFGLPQLLTETIPEYQENWQVKADAEGVLTDAEGRTYDYLFYESVTEASIFETESGWRIPADIREERFVEILSGLGFNEREMADFTEFWVEKLDADTDYLMYPQGTALVDLAMPVEIAGEPECMERIWFVFAKDDGRTLEAPAGFELTRGGADCAFYVLEWGGLILDE